MLKKLTVMEIILGLAGITRMIHMITTDGMLTNVVFCIPARAPLPAFPGHSPLFGRGAPYPSMPLVTWSTSRGFMRSTRALLNPQ
ncbi:hypothetical protein BD779DRAFT_1539150 [Infundibulicybe gibba]|nr:hypothetical protein BD779DRAFT_1539150 [Infundibulicybe gibba]